MAHVHALVPQYFQGLNHPFAQASKFITNYPNIIVLTTHLRQVTVALLKQEKFDPTQLMLIRRNLSIEQFFLDARKRYVSPKEAVVAFKEAALAFLVQYYAIEKADYGIPNYNQRVLLSLAHECVTTAQTLREFIHEERKQR